MQIHLRLYKLSFLFVSAILIVGSCRISQVLSHYHETCIIECHQLNEAYPQIAKDSSPIIQYSLHHLSFNEKCLQPNWVIYWVTKAMVDPNNHVAGRKNKKAKPDPNISSVTALYQDYTGSGYDRGHIFPAELASCSYLAMDECFYMSNICPQKHGFNVGAWQKLDDMIMTVASQMDSILVISGPILNKFIDTIGTLNSIPVPALYFKVVANFEGGNTWASAYIIPNQSKLEKFQRYLVPLDSIEVLTGFDFFPLLCDSIEKRIESTSCPL